MRALNSFDLIVNDLSVLKEELEYAKTSGDNIRVAKVTPNGNGTYTVNVDLLIGRRLADTLIGDYFSNSGIKVNSARSYKFSEKAFNDPKNSVAFTESVSFINPVK